MLQNSKIFYSSVIFGFFLCFCLSAYSQNPPSENEIGTVGAVRTLERTLFIDVSDPSKYKKGDRIFISSGNKTLTVTVERVISSYIVCTADLGTIRSINAGDRAFATAAVPATPPPVNEAAADSPKNDSPSAATEKVKKPEEQPIPRKRETGPTYFSIYGKSNVSDYRTTSPLYTGQPGINAIGALISFDSSRYGLDASYAVPHADHKDTTPQEMTGLAFFNVDLTDYHEITLRGKAAYHWLKDAKKFDTSSYTEGSLSFDINYFLRPGITYQQRYYFDSFHNDRNSLGDYYARLKLNPVRETFLNIDIAADYVSEEYADKKSTPENEGKKGLRDIYYDFRIILSSLRFGYVFTYVPAHDWKKETGSPQYDWYIDILPVFGALTVNLRYDYIDQAKRHPEKTWHLLSASARMTF